MGEGGGGKGGGVLRGRWSCVNNSFTEMEFTNHEIHPFKVKFSGI